MDNTTKDDEITLRELILLFQEYFFELKRNWWIILLFSIVSAVGFTAYQYSKPTTYTSNLTFMMGENKGTSFSGLESILAGSFGLSGGGGGGNMKKFLSLSKSRKIVGAALMQKKTIDGENDFYANHLMRVNNWEYFEDKENTKRFWFTRDDFQKTDVLENKVLKSLHGKVVGTKSTEGIFKHEIDELSGIVNISIASESEEFSIEFLTDFFDLINQYFTQKTIEKNLETYTLIKNKVDSLQQTISTNEYRLAKETDSGRNLVLTMNKLEQLRLRKELEILHIQYGEGMKNLAVSEYTLQSVKPMVQSIDLPIYPLRPSDISLPISVIIGGFLGSFLVGGFIIVRKVIRDALKEEA